MKNVLTTPGRKSVPQSYRKLASQKRYLPAEQGGLRLIKPDELSTELLKSEFGKKQAVAIKYRPKQQKELNRFFIWMVKNLPSAKEFAKLEEGKKALVNKRTNEVHQSNEVIGQLEAYEKTGLINKYFCPWKKVQGLSAQQIGRYIRKGRPVVSRQFIRIGQDKQPIELIGSHLDNLYRYTNLIPGFYYNFRTNKMYYGSPLLLQPEGGEHYYPWGLSSKIHDFSVLISAPESMEGERVFRAEPVRNSPTESLNSEPMGHQVLIPPEHLEKIGKQGDLIFRLSLADLVLREDAKY